MKLIASCLKSKSTIILDRDEPDSDISQTQPQCLVPLNKPILRKLNTIKSIHKHKSHPEKIHSKIEHIELQSDEIVEEIPQKHITQNTHPKKEHNPMKRRLIKASNKCKLQGRQFSSTQCSICLGSLENKDDSEIGKLSCRHAFCIDCIEKSSKFSNRCPYCRQTFNEIENGLRFIRVEEKNYDQLIDLNDQPCYVCGRNDDFDHLLECQFCQAAFCHTYCDIRLNSSSPPEDSWYCLSCSEIMQ